MNKLSVSQKVDNRLQELHDTWWSQVKNYEDKQLELLGTPIGSFHLSAEEIEKRRQEALVSNPEYIELEGRISILHEVIGDLNRAFKIGYAAHPKE